MKTAINLFKKIVLFLLKENKFIIYILIVMLSLLAFYYYKTYTYYKDKYKEQVEITYSVQNIFKDNANRWANAAKTWQLEASDFKKEVKKYKEYSKTKDVTISEQAKTIARLNGIIKDQNIRIKDLEYANEATMVTVSELMAQIHFYKDSLAIDTIRTKHLELAFTFIPPDSLKVDHKYKNTLYTFIEIRAKRKPNGRKHFPFGNWKWLWGKEYITTTTSEDTAAVIVNNVSIKFK